MIAAVIGQDRREAREAAEIAPPVLVMAEELGLMRRRAKRPRRGGPSCEDCFFHRHLLCALDLDGPCSTFRPDGPHGLMPPIQPELLPRRADAG